jgi:HD-like signal output (HDOD) protein
MEVYMDDILRVFLEELDQTQMIEYLSYCLSELITNAKKANTKRVYFKFKKLDITNQADYELGMKTFKTDTLDDINYFLSLQKKAGLYIRLILQYRNNKIKIEVRNNSDLTIFEYKRIHDKLSRAQQYTSVEQALEQIIDNSEGAGLGLVIMILMLEKIGLTEENFQVICENGETITRIILPLNKKTQDEIDFISDEFVKVIEELPQFPENISAINRLLSNPDSKMSDIAMQISNDVSLSAELLKLVNSAAFALASPCSSIYDAVKLVGLRGIKNLLFSIGAVQSFAKVGGGKEDLWAHAYQVAFYYYNLARNFFYGNRNVVEDDMGKIIFETSHPDFINGVRKMSVEKNISAEIFEKLVAGVNHAEIGARVAENWNFPDVIVSAIRYHHAPDSAPEEVKKLVHVVYLADLMTHYQKEEVAFYQIDVDVLKEFKLTGRKKRERI